MTREYLRVQPSAESLAPAEIPATLASLRKLSGSADGLLDGLLPGGDDLPTFEFLALSTGADEPVEFYYGADSHLDTLAKRLTSIYPPSFEIERTTVDPVARLLPTVAYEQEAFLERARAGELYRAPPLTSEASPSAEPPQAATAGDGGRRWLGADDDDGPAVGVVPAECGDATATPDEPQLTPSGTVEALPPVSETTPMGVEWQAFAARRKDWMTSLQPFDELVDSPETETTAARGRAPLAPVIEHLTEATQPMALQVVFERKRDWSRAQRRRTAALSAGEDRLIDIVLRIEQGSSERDSTGPPEADPERERTTTTRLDHVRQAEPDRTFVANVRALTLPVDGHLDTADRERLTDRLDQMCAAFDPVDGPYYEVSGQRLRSAGLVPGRGGRRAQTVTQYFQDRTVERERRWLPRVTNRPTCRPEFVLSGAELANFVIVPSGEALSETGDRGTRAEQESRHPLPLPDPEVLDAFSPPGMALGTPLDETGDPLTEAVWLPPSLQPLHIARFAKTGSGKSISGTVDALTAAETTDGPVFIIDAKGGSFPENYMRAHAARFGFESLREDVLHFSLPDVLPGLAPLNIEPRMDAGTPREQAVTELVNHYEQYLMLVMGEAEYKQATVSRLVIRALVRVMFDEEYGLEHGPYRESVNYCSQAQLEAVLDQFVAAGPPNPDPGAVPQASDDRLQARFERRLQADPNTFANIVGGVGTRLDYISDDPYLRAVFDNTEPRFDFREILDDDTVVLFDLGDLADEPSVIMAGVILTSLLNAIRDRDHAAAGDDYVANMIIDEAAAVATADILNDLLERGREFDVAVELLTQFPKQLELAGDREVFLNLLTNIETKLIGPLNVDDELAQALAHEEMDPTAFRNRVRRLPRGEWIAQLPSPEFQTAGPLPFSMVSLPAPAGHPESDEPFDAAEERRFQDALADVQERTATEYGVADGTDDTPPAAPPDAVAAFVGDEDVDYETVMAMVVRQVQLRSDQRESNGWVPVERIDETLREWVASLDAAVDPPGYETLTSVREKTRYVEVTLSEDATEVVCRLTEAGEAAAAPSTGDVEAAGSERHDAVLERAQRVLAAEGFTVTILEQDRSARPDARAIHPDLPYQFTVEAETTTPTKPAKILENLRRAHAEGQVPLFVVEAGEEGAVTDQAERVASVLSEPINTHAGDCPRLYNRDERLTFDGGAASAGDTTAVRPTTAGARETVWAVTDGAYVLTDPSGETHARVECPDEAPPEAFPGVYHVDETTGEYVVQTMNGEEQRYDSESAFEADWVSVQRPFCPEEALPVPEYAADTYAILILPADDSDDLEGATLYEQGETIPLACLSAGLYQPPADDRDPDHADIGDPAVAAFAAARLQEQSDGVVPVTEAYEAFERWAAAHGFEVTSEEWFSKYLARHLTFERERQYIDGEVVRCFVGLNLVPATDDSE